MKNKACPQGEPYPNSSQLLIGAALAANTGTAGAMYRVGFFAGTPAPTGTEQASG